ncbi:hypothetical protein VNO80_22979 [Phaseolus coccineus]|uniref:Uncharacterized protein n=1 Tax=Phaseolus coccineus TaxID=3886 RepID=A0AAN9QZB0_PHACN
MTDRITKHEEEEQVAAKDAGVGAQENESATEDAGVGAQDNEPAADVGAGTSAGNQGDRVLSMSPFERFMVLVQIQTDQQKQLGICLHQIGGDC